MALATEGCPPTAVRIQKKVAAMRWTLLQKVAPMGCTLLQTFCTAPPCPSRSLLGAGRPAMEKSNFSPLGGPEVLAAGAALAQWEKVLVVLSGRLLSSTSQIGTVCYRLLSQGQVSCTTPSSYVSVLAKPFRYASFYICNFTPA